MKTIILALLIIFPGLVNAQSTLNCHCFKERQYNPKLPAAADAYFLATTQNSFLSLLYGVDKKGLVKAKMTGERNDDLWIVYEFAKRSNKSAEQVRAALQKNSSLETLADVVGVQTEGFSTALLEALADAELFVQRLIEEKLVSYLSGSPSALTEARAAGMNNQQLILASLLSNDPRQLFSDIKDGKSTWGELLARRGINDGKAITSLLRQRL